ncbi:hypothetical protein LY76DRAFT_339506 [Colletotrichum caudatum]|nr:hypothetical protein LY76DRAFT_339506 [Colletotrichum caudatum]
MKEAGRPTTLKQRPLENWRRGRECHKNKQPGQRYKGMVRRAQTEGKGKGKKRKKNLNKCNAPLSICRLAAALHWTGNSSHAPQFPAGRRGPQESGRGPGRTLWCFSTPIPAPLLTKEAHAIPGQKGGCSWRCEPLGCLGMETGHLEGLASRGLALLVYIMSWMDCDAGSGNSRLSCTLTWHSYTTGRQAGRQTSYGGTNCEDMLAHTTLRSSANDERETRAECPRMMHCDNGR